VLSWVVNSRHTLRLTSPGTCVPLDLQLSTLNFSPCNSFLPRLPRASAKGSKGRGASFSFRTLCKIPGIGYPPPSLFPDSFLIRSPQSSTHALRSASARIAHFCAITPLLPTHAHFMGGGGYPPLSIPESRTRMCRYLRIETVRPPNPRCVDTSLPVRYALPFTPRVFSGLRRTDQPLHG
jgi:hypothetical protein